MEVNDALINKLANLSKLSFDEQEKERLKGDLQKMIGFIEKLSEVDTTGVEPLLYISPNVNILRKDVQADPMSASEATENAANAANGFFRVPKVIKK